MVGEIFAALSLLLKLKNEIKEFLKEKTDKAIKKTNRALIELDIIVNSLEKKLKEASMKIEDLFILTRLLQTWKDIHHIMQLMLHSTIESTKQELFTSISNKDWFVVEKKWLNNFGSSTNGIVGKLKYDLQDIEEFLAEEKKAGSLIEKLYEADSQIWKAIKDCDEKKLKHLIDDEYLPIAKDLFMKSDNKIKYIAEKQNSVFSFLKGVLSNDI